VRRALAWLLAVPLVLGGAQLAHAVDYWLIAPDGHERSELLAGTGHGYFSYLPFAVALLGGLLVAAFVAVSWDAGRGGTAAPLDRWPLALLPFATFVLQEHLERHLHDGAFPWHAAGDPTFALGLVLQIPFAVAAYFAARLLLRAADALGRLRTTKPSLRAAAESALPVLVADLVRRHPLADGHSSRGPPQHAPA
jgi:hypothetical protein